MTFAILNMTCLFPGPRRDRRHDDVRGAPLHLLGGEDVPAHQALPQRLRGVRLVRRHVYSWYV